VSSGVRALVLFVLFIGLSFASEQAAYVRV